MSVSDVQARPVAVELTTQDTAANDSGRESVNEFDSSLDESAAQLCKKPCTGAGTSYYTSSGSQSKWYCYEAGDGHGVLDCLAARADAQMVMSTPAALESVTVTPPKEAAETIVQIIDSSDGSSRPERSLSDTSSTIISTTTTIHDGISVIGIRNGFDADLSHQTRAVSSPSLTECMTAAHESHCVTDALASIPLAPMSVASSVSDESVSRAGNLISHTHHRSRSNSNANSSSNSNSSRNNSTRLATSQSGSVLQKFKRTLTNFNKNQSQQQQQQQHHQANNHQASTATHLCPQSAAAATSNGNESDGGGSSTSGKIRFGPLIWRTSKERRKTKYNRRDKCNSGDSGIQIELENDEHYARVIAVGGGGGGNGNDNSNNVRGQFTKAGRHSAIQTGSPLEKSRTVRRTNSATATNHIDQTSSAAMSAKAKILRKMEMCCEREAPESLPVRSMSQPNGLETFGIGGRIDLDDSDSDSVASHDEGSNYSPIYGEVLYNFTAAGPQELCLERGMLIEILRKEFGPWWFGRTKKEDSTLVEELLDRELGWFPKEFVRVIQSPEKDAFFVAHHARGGHPHIVLSPGTPVPERPPPTIQSSIGATTTTTATAPTSAAVDHNNVTTIVIESPPTYSSSSTQHTTTTNSRNGGGGGSGSGSSTTNIGGSSSGDGDGGDDGDGTLEIMNALAASRSINVSTDTADMVRRSAIKELLDTEVNYVKLLASICEGYSPTMSKRIDIFSPNSIRLIFSNITAIYKFQRKFLEALRRAIDQNQIAKVFLMMHKGFLCYSTYCNGYPRALVELESYERVKDAKTILENCRESENLAELPLSAHLLAPVQRICRYPLHLVELMKAANKLAESQNGATCAAFDLQQLEQAADLSQLDIPDTRETLDMALEAMKSVTEAVNEGKRHSETIARHQASFQNFKGPPLHLHSARFFLQIDATRQKQNLWNSSCTLFLFDNQLIYCKRDIIKRSQFIYKGRIFLDRCRVVNVRDGKMFGHTIKNSLRIYCEARDKWYDFSFRSSNRKLRLLNTLALERQCGGKTLYISEMTGFEYAFGERDCSDQSDCDGIEIEAASVAIGGGGGGGVGGGLASAAASTGGGGTSASGDSSVPESPVKTLAHKHCDTLPKKSQTCDAPERSGKIESQTGSLGRRRLGKWFRKPKSANSTPNQSPTHKPPLLPLPLPPQTADNVDAAADAASLATVTLVVEPAAASRMAAKSEPSHPVGKDVDVT